MKNRSRFLSLYLEITKRNICAVPSIKERKEIIPIQMYSFIEE